MPRLAINSLSLEEMKRRKPPQFPVSTDLREKIEDKLQVETLLKEQFALMKNNDRALTTQDIEFENKAEILSIEKFRRIHPRKATIGYLVRGTEGRNYQAIEYARAALPSRPDENEILNDMVKLIEDFDNLDLASQNRVDCLDWLCRRYRITVLDFLAVIEVGISAFYRTQTIKASEIIAENKPDLINTIFQNAKEKKNLAERRLAAEIAGLTGTKDNLTVNVNQQKVVNNIDNREQKVVLSFSGFVRKNDKEVRGDRLLGAKSEEVIEGEIVE